MRVWVLIVGVVLLLGCGTGQAVTVDGDVLTASDCASPHVQNLITYCASPQAADLAARNAELMGSGTRGSDVPYSPVPVGDSPVLGADSATVTIVMFTDLECPYCREMHTTLTNMVNESDGQVRVVFKHTPLTFHPNAIPAALAALAAREQGKFWEFVDRVYAAQDALGGESLLEHAAALGLDLEQFRTDLGSAAHIQAVEADLGLAAQVGVQGTPTMFVNGMRVVGVYAPEDIRALIENQKELVARLVEAGVAEADVYWRLVSVQYQGEPPSDIDRAEPAETERQVAAYVPLAGTPMRGAAADAALVTIVTFSDFQCPYCSGAVAVVDEILKQNPTDTRLSFRHFPLGNHPQAGPAAVASLVAHAQDKFWPYHDLLFAHQDDLSAAALLAHAKTVGIKSKDVESALADADLQSRIIADQKLGIDLGVQGTPTFFINGLMMMGIESAEAFAAVVDEQRELARSVARDTGLKGDDLYEAVVNHNRKTIAAQQ